MIEYYFGQIGINKLLKLAPLDSLYFLKCSTRIFQVLRVVSLRVLYLPVRGTIESQREGNLQGSRGLKGLPR